MEERISFSWLSWAPWGPRPLFLYHWILVFKQTVNNTLNYSASRWGMLSGVRGQITLAFYAFLDSVFIHLVSLITRSQQWPMVHLLEIQSVLSTPGHPGARAALPCPRGHDFPSNLPPPNNMGCPRVALRNWEVWPHYAGSQTSL